MNAVFRSTTRRQSRLTTSKNRIYQTLLIMSLGAVFATPSLAQSITPAPDGTGTVVTPNSNRYDISGGTTSQDGANLFHSFSQFGVESNQVANFLSNGNIRNILGRVTGGNASLINGIIQVTGGSSNLFLINPSGIIFGTNARLNVPASFTATTANRLGFGDNNWFNAIGNNNYADLVGNPQSFAFTVSEPGAIVNGANLQVFAGKDITLLGGTVVSTGRISAPAGNVIIAAVPGTNLVRISQPGSVLSLEIQPIAAGELPAIEEIRALSLPELLTGTGTETTGLTVESGTVRLTNSAIPIENGDIVVGNISTSPIPRPAITSANAGAILLSAQGNINTTQGTLNSSSTYGNGGAVSLTTNQGDINTAEINSKGDRSYDFSNGGAITLTANQGNITTTNLTSTSNNGYSPSRGGAITLTANQGSITTENINSSATAGYTSGNGGAITLEAGRNILTGNLNSTTNAVNRGIGDGGSINLTTKDGSITTGNIDTSSYGLAQGGRGTGAAGTITLTTDQGDITTQDLSSTSSGYNTVSYVFSQGGTTTLTTNRGSITTNNITTSAVAANGNGAGGAISLNAANGTINTGDLNSSFSLFGSSPSRLTTGNGGAINLSAKDGITSQTINSSSQYGNGGEVTLSGNNIAVSSINSQSAIKGTGANIVVEAVGTFRAKQSFIAQDGVTSASISSQGATGGGAITISQGGGLNNLFLVGDATNNGTAQDITSGNYRISATPIFTVPSPTYTEGNIQIITNP